MGKFYQCIQSYGPSFMIKFCSSLYLETLLRNIFAKLNLRGGVSCMPAALLFIICMLHAVIFLFFNCDVRYFHVYMCGFNTTCLSTKYSLLLMFCLFGWLVGWLICGLVSQPTAILTVTGEKDANNLFAQTED